MSSTLPEEIDISITQALIFPIVNLSVLYFVYGFYVLLFGMCLYMTCSRQLDGNQRASRNLHISLTVVLFVLSTAFLVDTTIILICDSIAAFMTVKIRDPEPLAYHFTYDVMTKVVYSFKFILPVFLNITTDYMLIHRCFVIWSSKKCVAVPLIVASVVANALGLVSAVMMTIGTRDPRIHSNEVLYNIGDYLAFAYLISSAVVNSILTLLTAGRIWWIYRQARIQGVQTSDTFVHSISKIILESGILYPTIIIASLIQANITTPETVPFDFHVLIPLSAGIAPTLIMVRAQLGQNVECLRDTALSDMRFTVRSTSQGTTATDSQMHVYSFGMAPLAREESDKRKDLPA
uniref:G protein-coupled receptor n=1 Tax=Moniliophthora roreri TaxID=221103 RepID=A0A0W0FWF4_MONRR